MTTQLSWLQASQLKVGDRVIFCAEHDIYPDALIPEGALATVTEQGLNEIWSCLCVKPDDAELQAKLAEWDGNIHLTPQFDRDTGNRERDWSEPSPLAKIAMTFAQFQATRQSGVALGAVIDDEPEANEPEAKGNLYLDGLYIEEVQPHWPEETKAQGKWHLAIGRSEWISDDLEMLERKLYEFAMSEGYGD